MKDLIIITDDPITSSSCNKMLINLFKDLLLLNDDDDTLYMKRSQRGFELWFTPSDVLDDPNNMMDGIVELCPNKKAYLTNLRYTSIRIASKIVSALLPHYGNMWIVLNRRDEWFGTAEDFLKLEL